MSSRMTVLPYAGSKMRLAKQIISLFPKEFNDYYEPFCGTASIFIELSKIYQNNKKYYLSDLNYNIINFLNHLNNNFDELVIELDKLKNKMYDKDMFRLAKDNLAIDDKSTYNAALFLFYAKNCFNGLYRVNKNGKLSISIGDINRKRNLYLKNELLNLSNIFKLTSSIKHISYEYIKPNSGDFVYLDPPYHNSITAYTANGFSDKDQIALSDFVRELSNKGVKFALSNNKTDLITDIYRGLNFFDINATQLIAGKSEARKNRNEVLITNY